MSRNDDINEAMGGWVAGGSFFGSIMAGFLLGYLADWWLGTAPWLVVSGIVAGTVNGFYRMMAYAKEQERKWMSRRG